MFSGKPGIRTLETLLTSAGFQDWLFIYILQQVRFKSVPHRSIPEIAGGPVDQGARIGLRK